MKSGVALLALALFLAVAPRAPFVGATAAEVETARAIVERGSLDIAGTAASPFTTVQEGRRFAIAPPLGALVLVPAELGAFGAHLLSPRIDRARIAELLESLTATLLALAVALLFFSDLERLGLGKRWAAGATLLLVATTALLGAARVPDGAALGALLVLLAMRGALGDSLGAALLCGAAAGALPLCDGATLPAALVLCAGGLLRRRSVGRGLALFFPLAAGVALFGLHHAFIGAPLRVPGDLTDGLYGLVLSTGKSVFLYSPPLFLVPFALRWWWRERRSDAALRIAVALALLIFVAASPRWDGDPAFGPRRLFLVVPLLLEPVACWLADLAARERVRGLVRFALLAVAVNGALVQLLGAALPPKTYLDVVDEMRVATGAQGWFADPRSECHFIPQFSPITGHLWLLEHMIRHDRNLGRDAPWTLLQQDTPKLEGAAARLRLDLGVLDDPVDLRALWLGLCAALALLGLWRLARGRRGPPVIRP